MAERILNLYATYRYQDAFWSLSEKERMSVRKKIVEFASEAAPANFLYSVFPTRVNADFLLWSAWTAGEPQVAGEAFTRYADALQELRRFVQPSQSLWGFTRPSMYSRGKSEQDMDPMDNARAKYLVVYPFSKTKEWYLMSLDARQGMMNEHIKIGKQFFSVKQLLLYSFGLQDQEFVVAYEMDDLVQFSDLVNSLRNTEGRRYTLLDTPLITGISRTPEEFIS